MKQPILKTCKACRKCGERKPLSAFHKHAGFKDGYQSRCAECCRTAMRATYHANADERKAKVAAWQQSDHGKAWRRANYAKRRDEITAKRRKRYAEDPDYRAKVQVRRTADHAANRARRNLQMVLRKYGLTLDQYNQMHVRQDYRCAICGDASQRLHVDHCHATGSVRGLLCPGCNIGIGALKEDPQALSRAIQYLAEAAMNLPASEDVYAEAN